MPQLHLTPHCDRKHPQTSLLASLLPAQEVGLRWLQSGVPLACPLRCVAPERIVANKAVRRLVHTLSPPPAEQPARQVFSTGLSKTPYTPPFSLYATD